MESWKKPWTKEQCEIRYVQGDRIGMRQLAENAGRTLSVVGMWASEGDWVEKREQYQNTLRTTVQKQTIEKTSDKLSDQLSEIAIANYQSLKLIRDYASFRIQIIAKDASRIKNLPLQEQLTESEKSTNNNTLETLSRVLQRAIAGINDTVGLKYHVDINAAIEKASREGYIVIDPNEQQN